MARNNQFKNSVNLKNSLKQQKVILKKYTNLEFENIKLLDFSNIKKMIILNIILKFYMKTQ